MSGAAPIENHVSIPYPLYPPGHEATPRNQSWQKVMMVAFAIGFCALVVGLLLLTTPLKAPAVLTMISGVILAVIAELCRKALQNINESLYHAAAKGSVCWTRILFCFGANPNCHAAGVLARDTIQELNESDPKRASVYKEIMALFDAYK